MEHESTQFELLIEDMQSLIKSVTYTPSGTWLDDLSDDEKDEVIWDIEKIIEYYREAKLYG